MVECEVVNVDREERRISLSVKALKRRADEREMAGFMNEADAPVTFGDIFREKLGGGSK
jgi:ribosomal protein S1